MNRWKGAGDAPGRLTAFAFGMAGAIPPIIFGRENSPKEQAAYVSTH